MSIMCGWSNGTANRCNGSCPSKGGVANFDTAGELLLYAFSAPTALRDEKIVVPGGMASGHSTRHNNFFFVKTLARQRNSPYPRYKSSYCCCRSSLSGSLVEMFHKRRAVSDRQIAGP